MMSRKEYMYSTGKTAKIESQNTFVCERAIFGGFNSFTVKKVSFFTINVKFKVILSSKSGGGGDVCTGHPPHPKSGGDRPTSIPPHPPGIYASAMRTLNFTSFAFSRVSSSFFFFSCMLNQCIPLMFKCACYSHVNWDIQMYYVVKRKMNKLELELEHNILIYYHKHNFWLLIQLWTSPKFHCIHVYIWSKHYTCTMLKFRIPPPPPPLSLTHLKFWRKLEYIQNLCTLVGQSRYVFELGKREKQDGGS